jgi:hypothetical protein
MKIQFFLLRHIKGEHVSTKKCLRVTTVATLHAELS